MELNRNTDIIRTNNTDYVNVQSNNRLIQGMVESIADEARSFKMLFGSHVDAEICDEMNGTYWMSTGSANSHNYGDDVQIVVR
jgi:hypothetical protein